MSNVHFRKDVTDAELERHMAPHIARFMGMTVPGVQAERTVKKSNSPETHAEVTEEERSYIYSIYKEPNLTTTQRADEQGLSSYANNSIKKSVLRKKLAVEVSINLGSKTSGICKFMMLTGLGYKTLGKRCPFKRPENTSPEHFWWASNLVKFYRHQGFKARLEMELNGKKSDVGVIINNKKIAFEIGLTANNEAVNARKNIDAGFDQVFLACRNSRVKKAVEQKLLHTLRPEERNRVKVILLSDFSFVQEILGKGRNANCTTSHLSILGSH